MKNNILLMILTLALVSISSGLRARSRDRGGEIEASSWRKFQRLTDRYRYIVAMFYYDDDDMGDLEDDVDELRRMFRAVSREQRYEDAQVAFLRINLVWRNTDEIAEAFQVAADKIPSFLLIKNGDAVRGDGRRPLMLTGYVSHDELVKFIDAKWHDELIDEAERIEETRERRAESSRMYWYYDPWPYYGWGWPWYGRRWGYYWW